MFCQGVQASAGSSWKPTLGYPPEKVQRHHLEIISVRTDCSMEFPPSLRRESGTCIKGPARLQNTGVQPSEEAEQALGN